MKTYAVSVDITMSKTISISAADENDAMMKVNDLLKENPYEYTNRFSHYVSHDVVDAEEEEE